MCGVAVHYKPYLKLHADEVRFDGNEWLIAFTPRGTSWEAKRTRPMPQAEMQQIWKAAGIVDALDDSAVKKHWKQIEARIKTYLIRTYWSLEEKK